MERGSMSAAPHRVLCASCLDPALGLPAIPDLSIDAIITDPPYSPKVHEVLRRGLTDYKERKGNGARATRNRDLKFAPLDPIVRDAAAHEFARLARRWVLVFSDQEGVGSPRSTEMPYGSGWVGALERAGLEYVRTGIWLKLGATPQMTGDRPAVGHECIVIAHRRKPNGAPLKKRWNGHGHHAVWTHPIVLDRGANGARLHTTQKPLGLMRELVELFTEPGELVLDPFAGSGTTGVACKILGRRFLGFDESPTWAALAQRRIDGGQVIATPGQLDLLDWSTPHG
jgi:site-specific DNA-methyltransferase (adenine-specific)